MTSKLDKLFGSKTRVALLTKLMLNPDRQFHIRELSKTLNIPYGMVYREIKNLASLEIINENRVGKITLISPNKSLPYFDDLKNLIIKTTGIAEPIREALSKIKGIKYALIFGSFAKGEESEASDIDVLIIGNVNEEKILKELNKAEEKTGREINHILWNEKEFLKKARSRHHLLTDIAGNPVIMLVGEEDEFRRAIKR